MRTLSILLFILLIGCKPEADLHDTKKIPPQLHDRYFLTEDGLKLPLHRWLPVSGAARAVILVCMDLTITAISSGNLQSISAARASHVLLMTNAASVLRRNGAFGREGKPMPLICKVLSGR